MSENDNPKLALFSQAVEVAKPSQGGHEVDASERDVQQDIANIVNSAKVVVFMKGHAEMPMCGFSHRAVAILKSYTDEFLAVNVLEDDAIRQGIKEYSDWPTIPQVYVDGEFLGGSDILMTMHESGELKKLMSPK